MTRPGPGTSADPLIQFHLFDDEVTLITPEPCYDGPLDDPRDPSWVAEQMFFGKHYGRSEQP